MLKLDSVTKRFGKTVAVQQLTLDCAINEFVVIFGPAGAGKSTTLRLIAGIIKPSEGDIYLHGHSLMGVPPENRNMSMVFENYALYSHLTVYDNLAFPLRAHKVKSQEIKQRVQDMAEVLQITPFLQRRPGFLSGGQRQRVALGRALIRDADVYLLDEPISHLDAKLRHRMRGELKAICAKKEATVMHVTHDYREAMALSDRIAVINMGRLMQFGTPDEIFHYPQNEFVASFVGEPPMSFLDVAYIEEGGKAVFQVEGSDIRLTIGDHEKSAIKQRALPKQFRVGVRAKEITVAYEPDTTHTIPAEVYVVETLGHRNIVTTRIGADQIKVITSPDVKLKVRDTIYLDIQSGRYHLFGDGIAFCHPVRQSQQLAEEIGG
ncbi:MAG: ABC transporter ATP-binding protein [Anaerolineae bacterium]|nr:ABC transporter ATP-binding protein [Anaerolineae bacterium]